MALWGCQWSLFLPLGICCQCLNAQILSRNSLCSSKLSAHVNPRRPHTLTNPVYLASIAGYWTPPPPRPTPNPVLSLKNKPPGRRQSWKMAHMTSAERTCSQVSPWNLSCVGQRLICGSFLCTQHTPLGFSEFRIEMKKKIKRLSSRNKRLMLYSS